MEKEELECLEWLIKMNERVTLILLKVKDKIDITEDDYDILRLWHRNWYEGVHPLYKTHKIADTQVFEQTGLFANLIEENVKNDSKK